MAQTTVSTTSVTAGVDSGQNYRRPLAMVTTLFFMWGFLTSLNDILIPHLKSVFDLNYAKAMLIQFAFFTSYFVFSLPSGKLIDAVGYKKAMVAGLFTMGLGALLFIPAASVPSFPLFLTALIVLAAGMTILQVSANPYVAILGPEKTAASRLNLAQAFNSLGTTIGPKLGGLLILSSAPLAVEVMRQMSAPDLQAYRVQQASSVKTTLSGLCARIDGLGRRHRSVQVAAHRLGRAAIGAAHDSIWRHTHLILGAVGIFVYVGAEVSIGSFLVNYFSQPDIGNISEKVAAGLGFLLLGRRDGRPLYRLGAAAKDLAEQDSRRRGARGSSARRRIDADVRPRRDVDDHRGRPVQLRDVPDDLHAGDRRTRPADRRRFRLAGRGDRGRRNHPGTSGHSSPTASASITRSSCRSFATSTSRIYAFVGSRRNSRRSRPAGIANAADSERSDLSRGLS